MSEPIVYHLKAPIEITTLDGSLVENITEITFRSKILARDLRVFDKHEGEIAKMLALIAHLSGRTIREIEQMELGDFGEIATIIGGFMPPGLLTGETA